MQTTLKEHGILKLHLVDYFNHSTFSYKFLSFPNLRQRKTRDWENIYVVCDLKMTSCSFFFKPFLKRRSLPSLSWWKMKKISFPGGCSIFRSRIVSHFVSSNNFFTKREFTIHLFSPRGNKSCCLSTVIPCYEKDPIVRSRPLFLHFEGGRGRGEKQKLTKDSSRRSYGRVSRGLSRISGETTMERNGRVWCLRVRPTWWQECTRISASALIIKPPLVFDGH